MIFADTQMDWMCSALTLFSQAIPLVTVYSTLGEDGLKFALQQTSAQLVVTDAKLAKVLSKVLPECPNIKAVVLLGEERFAGEGVVDAMKKQSKVATFESLVEQGKQDRSKF